MIAPCPLQADQCSKQWLLLKTKFTFFFIAERNALWYIISFLAYWGQLYWPCPLLASCPSSAYLLGEQCEKQRKTVQALLSASAETPVLALFSSQQETHCYMDCYEESYLHPSQAQYKPQPGAEQPWDLGAAWALDTRHLPGDRDGLRLGLDVGLWVGLAHWGPWLDRTGLWGAGDQSCCVAGVGDDRHGGAEMGSWVVGSVGKGVGAVSGFRSKCGFTCRFEFSRWVLAGHCQLPVLFFPLICGMIKYQENRSTGFYGLQVLSHLRVYLSIGMIQHIDQSGPLCLFFWKATVFPKKLCRNITECTYWQVTWYKYYQTFILTCLFLVDCKHDKWSSLFPIRYQVDG